MLDGSAILLAVFELDTDVGSDQVGLAGDHCDELVEESKPTVKAVFAIEGF
ncbi:hypothetical protein NXC12_PD00310 (plasmid) [Rhizobium etli]|uniref:Uncharacterized protein n=2 Tax=Rhizobium TaxID=379 RepID=A0AAN1BLK5_RHIET|nr:hypothetical protein [Rhizobium etli]ARO32534.1 hypothetical protein NXC14_PA00261 [Rhizobium sp. NXC14]ARQ13404.1 hypothetical protein NXC12_PD00310 [Rhizobium etli]